jgi:hypothetical protein
VPQPNLFISEDYALGGALCPVPVETTGEIVGGVRQSEGLLSQHTQLGKLGAATQSVITIQGAYTRRNNILAVTGRQDGYKYNAQLQLSSHQPLMMETKTVSKMFDSIFTWSTSLCTVTVTASNHINNYRTTQHKIAENFITK